jgi:hypothetical protein
MSGYNQILKIKSKYSEQAKDFLKFLNNIGKKYERPTKINYRYLGRGRFYIMVDGSPGGIDALFQELVLNRGLYYYSHTLKDRQNIISQVLVPVFSQLIDYRFENNTRFIKKHILGKTFQGDFVPSDISNRFGYLFDILFRKWDIGIISDKDYVESLDSLITNFLLIKTNHQEGDKSPSFKILLGKFKKSFIINDINKIFHKIHEMRTKSLHRLKNIEKGELMDISYSLIEYFKYLDEFEESQKLKTIKIQSKRYRRIRYGNEKYLDSDGRPFLDKNGRVIDFDKIAQKQDCGDCGVKRGQFHVTGCDLELCPKCGGQFISCRCHKVY